MRFAVWYDNCTGYYEAAFIVEANDSEEAIASACLKSFPYGTEIVITSSTQSDYGFGNDPNSSKNLILNTTIIN